MIALLPSYNYKYKCESLLFVIAVNVQFLAKWNEMFLDEIAIFTSFYTV